jgi:SAM-dependent methyltransferase
MAQRDSIRFDRAAECYDRTRAIPAEALRATIDLLSSELDGRGRCLEIGVGTGILALELHAAGVRMAGLDLSAPMLAKLVEKAGGREPFPLVLGDATRLPFPGAAFGGGLARHVFHLIPAWEEAVAELARVVRPGGTVLVNLGDVHRSWELVDRFLQIVGGVAFAVGLDPRDPTALDAAFTEHGARRRELPPVPSRDETRVGEFIGEIESGMPSWTWRVPDDERRAAIPELRAWAMDRFGSLEEVLEPDLQIVWRAYDFP